MKDTNNSKPNHLIVKGSQEQLEAVERFLASQRQKSNEIVQEYVNQLTDSETREEAIYQLGLLGSKAKDAVSALLPYLQDSDEDIRWLTAETLGLIGSDEAVECLIKSLNNNEENTGVRKAAATALGKIGYNQAIKPLIELLNNSREDWFFRKALATALVEFDDEKAIEAVNSFLNQVNSSIPEITIFSNETLEMFKRLLPSPINCQDLTTKLEYFYKKAIDSQEKCNQIITFLQGLAGTNFQYAYMEIEKSSAQ